MKCLTCGNPLPDDSEFCQYCGKKIETPKKEKPRGSVFKSVCIGVLAVFCMALIGLNVYQYTKNKTMNEQLIQATETIWEQEKTITKQKHTISDQEAEIGMLEIKVSGYRKDLGEALAKTVFMDDYVVIIGDSNNKYHKYGCEDLDLTEFLVYNIENAKYQGHRACSKCN